MTLLVLYLLLCCSSLGVMAALGLDAHYVVPAAEAGQQRERVCATALRRISGR
jgi:hypothetical protein